jgi:hypothetical protein
MVNAAVQFHLWHPFLKRPSVNEGMFNEVIAKKNPRAQLGLAEMKAELEKSSGQTQSEQAQGEQK